MGRLGSRGCARAAWEDEVEKRELVVQKRISLKNFIGTYLLLIFAAGLIWGIGYSQKLASGWIVGPAGLAPLVIGGLWIYLVYVSTEYRVFQDSLEVESGIISRNIENIQLFRVRDIGLKQGIVGRILNVGNIAITSTDQSNPHFTLHGVDGPRGMYDTLRDLVSKSQATRRTVIMEDDVEASQALEQ